MGLVGRNMAVLLGGAAMTILLGAQAGWAQETEQTEQATTEQQQAQVVNEADKKGRVTQLQRLVLGAGVEKVAVDTPSAVTVLDQTDIDTLQPETIGEIIEAIPGVNNTGSAGCSDKASTSAASGRRKIRATAAASS
jgi:hemoglobin/transferrin/lactoferrin receptor protein